MLNTDNDTFAKTLEFEVLENRFGYARARGKAKAKFLNGLGIAHGGFLFSLADFALALAANTETQSAVSASASINYISPCPADAVITAEARLAYADKKTGLFDVRIYEHSPEKPLAIFQARAIFKHLV